MPKELAAAFSAQTQVSPEGPRTQPTAQSLLPDSHPSHGTMIINDSHFHGTFNKRTSKPL